MKKRVQAIILMIAMIVSMFGTVAFDAVEVEAANTFTLKIHYLRADGNYDDYNAWTWDSNGKGGQINITGTGDKGAIMEGKFNVGVATVGFIVRKGTDWADGSKDFESDLFVDVAKCAGGTVNVYYNEKNNPPFTTDYSEATMVEGAIIESAYVDADGTIVCSLSEDVDKVEASQFAVATASSDIAVKDVKFFEGTKNVAVITTNEALSPTSTYKVTYNYISANTDSAAYFSGNAFEIMYTYEGDDLGATYTKEKTTFKVWAPTASEASLMLYETDDQKTDDVKQEYPLTLGEKGVWACEVTGDLNGQYYGYKVVVDGKEIMAGDPYARAASTKNANAAYLKSMVIDLDATDPEGWADDKYVTVENVTDSVIYELHVRDFSADPDSGITNVGKYLAFTEKGTKTSTGFSTGLDYLSDLGINFLHLLPTYDFNLAGGDYNWGYNPVNYNAVEDSYGTDPTNQAQTINEYKQMVQALHGEDIGLVIDVVYNHVDNARAFSFERLVPGYFLRPNSNSSGCGSDVASERSMVKKYIVDSVKFWQDEYHVDGYRFDLMGILDVETMNEVAAELRKVNPDVLIYGEGWQGYDATKLTREGVIQAKKENSDSMDDIACFSDTLRNAIKGGNDDTTTGYVNSGKGSGLGDILKSAKGAPDWAQNPTQVINYMSAHDNLTVWDKIQVSTPDATEEQRISMNLLGAAIVYTSQGIPFTMSGEELLRTKDAQGKTSGDAYMGFYKNSYRCGDEANFIDYSRAEQYKNVYEYYKGLIEFRKNHAALRLTTAEEVEKYYSLHLDEATTKETNVVAFKLGKSEKEVADEILVAYNGSFEEYELALPEGEWKVCVNGEKAGTDVIETVSGSVKMTATSCYVLVKGETVAKEDTTAPSTDNTTSEETKKPQTEGREKFFQSDSTTVVTILVAIGAVIAALGAVFYFINKRNYADLRVEENVLDKSENRLLNSDDDK